MRRITPMFESGISDIFGYPVTRGKVRDTYDISQLIGKPALLIVATDRISVFDVVLGEVIPLKGAVLTAMTLFWLDHLEVSSHLITADINEYPKELQQYRDQLEGRSMIVKKRKIPPIEWIMREYLTGSGKKSYDETGYVCGHKLPEGLIEASKLPETILTPSTKAEQGEHDENITRERATEILLDFLGEDFIGIFSHDHSGAERIFDEAEYQVIEVFERAAEYASQRGILLADTKFEISLEPYPEAIEVIFCDEVLTPDSSRFWSADSYKPGRVQDSFDKQYIRDYERAHGFIGEEGQEPVPLPDDVIEKTTQKYLQAYEMLTGQQLQYCF